MMNKRVDPADIDPDSITIKFPCEYPIRIVGDASSEFRDIIMSVVSTHAPQYIADSIREKDSKKGNYRSLSLIIHAQSKTQLEQLFEALKATGIVHMVL